MSVAANGCNEKKHSSQPRFRCPLYSVHKVSSHLYLEKVDGQYMDKQTKLGEAVFTVWREACSSSGPSCVVDLDSISEQCVEMGHGTAENRPWRM